MRTGLQLVSVLALVGPGAGCVDVPDDDPFVVDGDLCQTPCEFPPDDGSFQTALLPAQVGEVDGRAGTDMVIGNGPQDGDYWGFFFVSNIEGQSGALRAQPFKSTQRRPLAIHLEPLEQGLAKVVIFGEEPDGGVGVEVYSWDTDQFYQPTEPSAVVPGPDDSETPVLTAGVFDDNDGEQGQLIDVAFGYGNRLWVWDCAGSECAPLQELEESPGAGVIDGASDIELIQAIPSPLQTSALYSLQSEGSHDIVLAADGNIRYFTYADDTSDGDGPAWVSIPDFVGFSVMGSMGSASLRKAPGGPNASLILGGDGGSAGTVDFTPLLLDDPMAIAPGARVVSENPAPWAGDDVVAVQAAEISGSAQRPELIVVGRDPASERFTLYAVGDVEVRETTYIWAREVELGLDLAVASMSVIGEEIVVFSRAGGCASYLYGDNNELVQTPKSCLGQ